jgi:hypothetical protein
MISRVDMKTYACGMVLEHDPDAPSIHGRLLASNRAEIITI